MALDRLTKIDGGGISTTSDYRVGVITATKFVGPIDGAVTGTASTATLAVNAQGLTGTPDIVVGIITASSANFSGNVTIGGTLTYEDVTNIDSVGIITARNGLIVSGVSTFQDIDVDGHTNLDNVSISGVTTITSAAPEIHFTDTNANSDYSIVVNGGEFRIRDETNSANRFYIASNGNSNFTGNVAVTGGITNAQYLNLSALAPSIDFNDTNHNSDFMLQNANGLFKLYDNTNTADRVTVASDGKVSVKQDLDVDGHTNLDNVSIAGIVTATEYRGGGSTGIKVTSAGKVLIGTSNQGSTSADELTIENTGPMGISLRTNSTGESNVYFADGTSGTDRYTGYIAYQHQYDRFRFGVNGGQLAVQINEDKSVTFFDNVSVAGVTTFTGNIDANGDLDVDGHTNLDNVSVAGVSTFSSNVTISPSGDPILTVTGSGHPQLTLTNTSGSDHCGVNFGDSSDHNAGMIQYTNNGDYMVFHTAGAERIRIDSSGNITAVNPNSGGQSVTLKIGASNASGTNDGVIRIVNGGTGNGVIQWDYEGNASRAQIYVYRSDQELRFTTAGSERFRIYNTNTLGIARFISPASGDTLNLQTDAGGGQGMIFGTDISNSHIYLKNNSSGHFGFQYKHGATTQLQVASDGKILTYTTGSESSQFSTTNSGGAYQQYNLGASGAQLGYIGSGDLLVSGSGVNDFGIRSQANMVFSTGGAVERLRITSGGVVKIGGDVSNASADVGTVTKLTIKQGTNTHEGGMYIERSGERRGWYMYVGGAGGYNDALCLTTNQLGTDTNVLAIDRGNRLAKLGGDVIIDSSNNGYGGLRIYDDTSGGYNVNYVGGRSDGNMCHKFFSGGRSQNQSPWTDTTGSEIMRISLSNGIQLHGDSNSGLQYHSGDHYKFRTNGRERVHIDNRGVMTAPKLSTKALIFSPVTSKWGSQRTVANFVMQFYTGASGATYHFMRMISQTDWGFDDVEIRQYRYQYNPSGSDHTVRRYYTYYGGHGEQIVRYNQNGSGTGTSNDNYINKRTDFGPGGALQIHQASNGGYYRDCYGSDYAISLGAYYGVVLEIKITATVGTYDTGDYATAYDFYPANYGAQATQSNADNWNGPRGVWFNTTSNGTGTGTAPCISNKNSERGWHTGTSFLDTSA